MRLPCVFCFAVSPAPMALESFTFKWLNNLIYHIAPDHERGDDPWPLWEIPPL